MELVHYSKTTDFVPRATESVSGFGKGCFFYPIDAALEWTDRTPFYFEAPDAIVEEVQRFEPGEVGNDNLVIEVFVRARNLKRLVAL